MVTGWSYLVASSTVPASCISCTSALPREVTRNEISESDFPISCIGGSTVTGPCHFPAKVFMVSKDFCASDFGAVVFCASVWAKATAVSASRTTIKRWDFMLHSPKKFFLREARICSRLAPGHCDQAMRCTVILNYNTTENVKRFLEPSQEIDSEITGCRAQVAVEDIHSDGICTLNRNSLIEDSHVYYPLRRNQSFGGWRQLCPSCYRNARWL